MKTFWKWWSSILLMMALAIVSQIYLDIRYYVSLDKSYISYLIIAIFLYSTVRCGYVAYRIQILGQHVKSRVFEPLWFKTSLLTDLGMVGTFVGFLIVLTTAFNNIDTTSAEEMKQVISVMATGMGVALLTTLTGLIGHILLKLQLVILESDNAKVLEQPIVH